MDKEMRVLIVEDSGADAELIARELGKGDFAHTSKWVKSKEEFLGALGDYAPDMILCDYKMPLLGAPAALEIAKERCPETPFIVVSGTIGEDTAVEMMKSGAADYVMKDKMVRLVPAVTRALAEVQAHADRKRAEAALIESESHFRMLTESSLVGISIFQNGFFQYVNSTLQKMLGYSSDELLKLEAIQLVHPEDRQVAAESIRQRIDGETEVSKYACRLIRKSGELIDVEAMGRRVLYHGHPAIMSTIQDITDRKRAEEALRESAQRWQETFDAVSDAVWLLSPDCRILQSNKASQAMFHLKAEELVGQYCYEVVHGTDKPHPECPISRMRKSGHRESAEFLLGGRWFMVTVDPLFDPAGSLTGIVHIVSDITDRKRIEKQLRESEAVYRGIFESSWDAMMLLEPPSWRFTAGNPAMLRMFGASDEAEFILHYPWTLSPERQPDGRLSEEKAKAMIEIAMDRGVNFFEWTHQRTDGASFPAEVLLTRIERNGKVFLQSTVRDITERKRMELQLMQAKEMQLKTLIELLPSKVFLKDRNAVYLSCNSNYAKDLKIHPEEIAGKTDYDFFPTHLAEKQREEDQRIMESGKTESREDEYHVIGDYLAGGQKSYINIVKAPVRDKSGAVVGLFGLFWDITEQKVLEEEKEKMAEVQVSADIKSKFTAMVSHELRSPVAVIKEALDIVLEGMTGSLGDQQKEILGMAKTNIDRLGRLINNVLDFQKIESGKMKFDIAPNDLKEVLTEVHKSMSILSKRKGLDLRLELAEGLPQIKFDRDRLIQVLTNLMNNAIHNTERGIVTLAAKKEKDEVHISVQDAGIGIAAGDIPKLFQPFEQVDGSRSKQKGGTGLGLAISKEIILAHQGKIWAESVVEKGSTFHFTLPL